MQTNKKPVATRRGACASLRAFPTVAVTHRVNRIENGVLVDEEELLSSLPTCREAFGYDDLGFTDQVDLLLEHCGLRDEDLAADYDLSPGPEGWSSDQHHELECLFLCFLDEPVYPEVLSAEQGIAFGPRIGGFAIYAGLPPEVREELGLMVVGAGQPGSDYRGVCYLGDLAVLNAALRRHGSNILVRDSARENSNV